MPAHLGYTRHGRGPRRVLVLHDWFADHSSWDPTLPYLSPERFTYAFADLRGYGASRGMTGTYSLAEAVDDCVALLDHLAWPTCALVGHSMSSLVVQRLAQLAPERVVALVAVTPVPPTGMGVDDAGVAALRALAFGSDDERVATLTTWWTPRLSEAWVRYKARRWREAAAPEAAAGYVELFGQTDVSTGARGVTAPVLVVAGEHDAPPFQPNELRRTLLPFYPQARMVVLGDSGHYPMQEQPPRLATEMEAFLAS